MPKLLALIACERVILDKQDMPSLINVFRQMNMQLLDAPLPEKAISPVRWFVFTLWQNEETDIEKKSTQLLEVVLPNGEIFSSAEQEFRMANADDIQSKITLEFNGVPVWQEGVIQVRASLKGSEEPAHIYKIQIKHLPKKESNVKTSDA